MIPAGSAWVEQSESTNPAARREYDVIIVGSGLGGLASALFASMAGLRPVVLEKADVIGGASCWSYGAVWMGCNDLAHAAGIEDDPEAVAAYLSYLGGGENNLARTRALMDAGTPALHALNDAGIFLDLMTDVNDILFGKAPGAAPRGRTLEARPLSGHLLGDWRSRLRTPPGEEWRVQKSIVARAAPEAACEFVLAAKDSDQLAQGTALIARILLALKARAVPIFTLMAAESVITEAGRVVGIRAIDGSRWYGKRATILASGNYLANEAWVSRLEALPGYRSWYPDTHTGDGIALATPLGAAIGITRNNLMVMLGYDDLSDGHDANAGVPSVRDLPRAHTIVVNRAGLRFGNEALFQELAPALRVMDLTRRQAKNLPCWMICDHQYASAWGLASAASKGPVAPWVVQSADIAALAHSVGIDAQGLTATVARFNEFATRGSDDDFGRQPGWTLTPGSGAGRNSSLGKIEQPPFFAALLRPTLGGASAGLRADASARVLDWREQPIEGLYAVGDVAQHDEFGAGYQAGITFASALTFAFLAARRINAER